MCQFCSPQSYKMDPVHEVYEHEIKEGRPDPGEDRMTEDYAEKHLHAAVRLLKERGDDYGPIGKCMRHAAKICAVMWGLQLEARDIARVLFALKIAREQWKHKDDNIHDALAFLAILGSLSEGNDE